MLCFFLFVFFLFLSFFFFFFNDTATTEIYTLSLHDALPIWTARSPTASSDRSRTRPWMTRRSAGWRLGSGTARTCSAAVRRLERGLARRARVRFLTYLINNFTYVLVRA